MSRTHYSTLGVEPTAGRDAIKGAYYDLRKRFSALKRPTDDQMERLVRINAAWDVLKLPDRRRDYDAELGLGGDAPAEPEADEAYQEALRRTAAARKATSDAAAAAAERRAEAAAAERRAKRGSAAPTPPMPEAPPLRPTGGSGLPGGTRYWAMGAGFAVAYVALSAVMHRGPAPTPTSRPAFVEAAVPQKKAAAASPPASRHVRRRKPPGVHRSRSTQNATDLNRLELERLRKRTPAPAPSATPTKSDGVAE